MSNTSFQTTKGGWVVGGGAEWMATTNILLRAEDLYYGINGSGNGSAGTSPAAPIFPLPFNYAWTKETFRCSGSRAATCSKA